MVDDQPISAFSVRPFYSTSSQIASPFASDSLTAAAKIAQTTRQNSQLGLVDPMAQQRRRPDTGMGIPQPMEPQEAPRGQAPYVPMAELPNAPGPAAVDDGGAPPAPRRGSQSPEDLIKAGVKKELAEGKFTPTEGASEGRDSFKVSAGTYMPSGSTQQIVAQETPRRMEAATRLGLL